MLTDVAAGIKEFGAAIAATLLVAAPVAYKLGRVLKSDAREDNLFTRMDDTVRRLEATNAELALENKKLTAEVAELRSEIKHLRESREQSERVAEYVSSVLTKLMDAGLDVPADVMEACRTCDQ